MFKVTANLLPSGGAEFFAGEGGQHEAAIVLEVDVCVARVAREAAHHVFDVIDAVAAAHVGGEEELEAAVQA